MASRRVKFTYTAALIPDPVIYELGKRFPIVTNIRRADVRETFGWVILEMTGEDADMDRGLEWVRSKGVRVDPAGGDVVES